MRPEIDLGDVTLLPGLMDMELNLLLGGPHGRQPAHGVQDDPRSGRCGHGQLPHDAAGRVHDRAQSRPVREDRRLPARRRPRHGRSTRAGSPGPASCRPGTPSPRPAATSTRRCSSAIAPGIMPLSVEEGIANGVPEVRKAVRYQIKYGAGAHQDLRLRRRDVAQRARRAPSSTPTRSSRPSSTRRTAPGSRSPRTRTATPASAPASAPASTASSTARWRATTPSS